MSDVASWTYVRDATIWPRLGVDAWGGAAQYDQPVAIKCAGFAKVQQVKASGNINVVSTMEIRTEYAAAKEGDLLLLAQSASVQPPQQAVEIKAVKVLQDIFGIPPVDDWVIYT